MTPYQLSLHAQDYAERKKAENEEKIAIAWLGAYLQRVKKMPSLNKMFSADKPKKKMAPEEILEAIKRLNSAFGGTTY